MKIQTNLYHKFAVALMVLFLKTAQAQLLFGNGNSFGAYNFDGTLFNPSFIAAGLSDPQGIAIGGTNIFVANQGNGTIAEYNLDGTLVNAAFISNVHPAGIAVDGTNLYVANSGNTGTVGKYNLDGTPVNTSLITNVVGANGLAISGTNLYLACLTYIAKYNLDGTVLNSRLISPLHNPAGIAISGTNLFVASFAIGIIGKYNLDGTVVNGSLVSGLGLPNGLAACGNTLYVQCAGSKKIGAYQLDGTVLNASFVSGLTNPPGPNYGILVMPPPIIQTTDGSFGVQTNAFGFNITGISNQTVSIEACSNLAGPTWTSIQTNVLVGCRSYFSDPEWSNFPTHFYRVRAH